MVLSGAYKVKVIAPDSMFPPDKTAVSSGIALPTTLPLPALNEAVVIRDGAGIFAKSRLPAAIIPCRPVCGTVWPPRVASRNAAVSTLPIESLR